MKEYPPPSKLDQKYRFTKQDYDKFWVPKFKTVLTNVQFC